MLKGLLTGVLGFARLPLWEQGRRQRLPEDLGPVFLFHWMPHAVDFS